MNLANQLIFSLMMATTQTILHSSELIVLNVVHSLIRKVIESSSFHLNDQLKNRQLISCHCPSSFSKT